MTEAIVKMAVQRMRSRSRELLREEVARTVASPDEIEDEIPHLFPTLGNQPICSVTFCLPRFSKKWMKSFAKYEIASGDSCDSFDLYDLVRMSPRTQYSRPAGANSFN